jgi:rubredoxin
MGMDVSEAWLFGATGHALIINMHEVVCPSGPTAWNTKQMRKLGENVGYASAGLCASRKDADFDEKRRLFWDNLKLAVDNGMPSYGWELDVPEYYVICGYDDVGYYYSGPPREGVAGPKPWEELGDTEIGMLEMYSLMPGDAADDRTTVREALAFALAFAESPEEWVFPKYKAGPAAFDVWAKALEGGTADSLGAAYNAQVWHECREFAVKFLEEAKERLGGPADAFDEAIKNYRVVAAELKKVAELFPFLERGEGHVKDKDRCAKAAATLRAAREAEEAGLAALAAIRDGS